MKLENKIIFIAEITQMGNGVPVHEKTFMDRGDLFNITLDRLNYHEGSIVTGNVNFTLSKSTPPIQVHLRLVGFEKVRWYEKRHINKKTRYRRVDSTIRIRNDSFLVIDTVEDLFPGQFSYPVSFELPDKLAGTFVYKKGYDKTLIQASVWYYVYAEIKFKESSTIDPLFGRASTDIVIMQKPRDPPKANIEESKVAKIDTWCCCSKGAISIEAIFEKDLAFVSGGDSLLFKWRIDCTDLKLNIKFCRPSIERKIMLNNNAGKTKYAWDMIRQAEGTLGCDKGAKQEEFQEHRFFLDKAHDPNVPNDIKEGLGELSGKVLPQ